MYENTQEINSECTVYEPAPEEISFCAHCDVEISIHDAHEGLCAVCDHAEGTL